MKDFWFCSTAGVSPQTSFSLTSAEGDQNWRTSELVLRNKEMQITTSFEIWLTGAHFTGSNLDSSPSLHKKIGH